MRKMKDSGIEWIGEIPESWGCSKVKYYIQISNGSDPKTEGDIPVYGSGSGCFKTCGESKDGPAVLLGRKGTIDIPRYIEGKYWNVDTAFDVKTDETSLLLKYYFYLSTCFDYRFYTATTTLPSMTQTSYENMFIPVPDIDMQHKIVAYIESKCKELDMIIAAKEKTNELLKERRQSIIYEAVTKGLDPTVSMKDSGVEWIGEIPESWDVCPVKYVIDKNHPYPVGDGDHGLIKADDYLDEGIPYIRVLNLTWGEGLNLENLVYISDEMNSRIKNSELKPNDILIAKTGATIGKTAIVPDSLPRSNTTSHVGKITISSDHDAVFFYYVMTSSIVQRQIQALSAMQSTRPELGIDGLKNLLVVVPPVEKQRDISEFLNQQCAEINAVIDTNSSMIDKLKEYRQSVIYEAVTGKVKI